MTGTLLRTVATVSLGLFGTGCALSTGPEPVAVQTPNLKLQFVPSSELAQVDVTLLEPWTSDHPKVSKQTAADFALGDFPIEGSQVREEVLARVLYSDAPRTGVLAWVVDVTLPTGSLPIGTGAHGGPYPPPAKWLLVFVKADTGSLLFAKAWAPPGVAG